MWVESVQHVSAAIGDGGVTTGVATWRVMPPNEYGSSNSVDVEMKVISIRTHITSLAQGHMYIPSTLLLISHTCCEILELPNPCGLLIYVT